MHNALTRWVVVTMVCGLAAYAVAEEITLTTYYPSPRGVYEELRTTKNTFLAIESGNVGIGTTAPVEKVEVNGGLRLNPSATTTLPTCTAERRGTLWFQRDVKMGQQLIDRVEFCARVHNRYAWITVSGQLTE